MPPKAKKTSRGRSTSRSRSGSKSRSRSQSGSKSRSRSSSKSRSRSGSKSGSKKGGDAFLNKPWRSLTAMSKKDRAKMPANCFLDSKNRKYPICYKNSRAESCKGLTAAERRAASKGRRDLVARAASRRKKLGCGTEKSKSRERAIYRRGKSK